MKQIEVVAAIIIKDNRILCTQRSKHKYSYISEKFEFPGGKIEEGETEVEALIREIQEELFQTTFRQEVLGDNTPRPLQSEGQHLRPHTGRKVGRQHTAKRRRERILIHQPALSRSRIPGDILFPLRHQTGRAVRQIL